MSLEPSPASEDTVPSWQGIADERLRLTEQAQTLLQATLTDHGSILSDHEGRVARLEAHVPVPINRTEFVSREEFDRLAEAYAALWADHASLVDNVQTLSKIYKSPPDRADR